jgi:hypothetical protein
MLDEIEDEMIEKYFVTTKRIKSKEEVKAFILNRNGLFDKWATENPKVAQRLALELSRFRG